MSELVRPNPDVTEPARNGGQARWNEERYRTLFDLGPVAVELHGGSVRAESGGRDAGTRFVMHLPRRQSSSAARDARTPAGVAATIAAPDVPRFDGLRILIVDDDRESCEMMLEALRGYGASVRCAMSATEAIDALPEFSPDLVLSDIAMPGRDGFAVPSAPAKQE
jgi:hypothetical protein